jgi:hypothetical protein
MHQAESELLIPYSDFSSEDMPWREAETEVGTPSVVRFAVEKLTFLAPPAETVDVCLLIVTVKSLVMEEIDITAFSP